MARELIFDARFVNDAGVGQEVDSNLYVEIWEDKATSPKETRTLSSDPKSGIIKSSDASGTFYTTTVDVSSYLKGGITAKWYAQKNGTNVFPYPFTETLSYPFDAVLNSSDIKDYIRNMLGFPAISVELTGEHYRTIVEEALSAYNQHIPRWRVRTLDLVLGQNSYPLLDIPSSGPVHVGFVRKEGVPLISDPLFGREYPRGQQLDFDQYVLGISFWEMLNRVTSQEPEWWWDAASKTLYINIGGTNVAGASGNYFVAVFYFESVGLDGVRNDHMRWFRRYCLAQAKKILGSIRGKFSGKIPTPGGGATLDSDVLRREGREEEMELIEEARGMAPVPPPIHG